MACTAAASPRRRTLLVWPAFVALALAACGSDVRSVELRRVVGRDPDCGRAPSGQTLRVTALGDFAGGQEVVFVPLDGAAAIDVATFPPATRVIKVEALGAEGFTAVGKTAPFLIEDLEDGDTLDVFMAPPGGACEVQPMATARTRPLAARAGAGVLVAGGFDAAMRPAPGLEWYVPGQAGFVDAGGDRLYGAAETGLLGASMTELVGGRVVIAGGGVPAFQTFDPIAGELDSALFLRQLRAWHAAVALADGRLLLVGGCGQLAADGGCEPASLLRSTSLLDVTSGSDQDGPELAVARWGAHAIGEPDGKVLIIGGLDAAGVAVTAIERLDLAAGSSTVVGDGGAAVAALAAGGVVTAFAPSGAPPDARAAVVPPRASAVAPVAAGPESLAGATVTDLQDGTVLGLGAAGAAAYVPQSEGWSVLDLPSQVPRSDHLAVRLDDGSVLVAGGDRGAGAVVDAWIVRPGMAGPWAPGAVINFGDPELARLVVPSDPARAATVPPAGQSPAHYRLEAAGGSELVPGQLAVVAAPALLQGALSVGARAEDPAGLALVFGHVAADRFQSVRLQPGQPATVEVVEGDPGRPTRVCSGAAVVTPGQLAPPGGGAAVIDLVLGADRLEVRIAGELMLSCGGPPSVRGRLGVGALGPAGAAVEILTLVVQR